MMMMIMMLMLLLLEVMEPSGALGSRICWVRGRFGG